jgi:hypothetical protein
LAVAGSRTDVVTGAVVSPALPQLAESIVNDSSSTVLFAELPSR